MLEKIHPHYYLGAFIGLVVGYMMSKIYQIWAIAYIESQLDPNMATSSNTNSPPLWVIATEKPMVFSFWVVIIFIIVGIVFTRILKK